MTLSAPTMMIFVISLVLAVLAILGVFASIPVVSANAFWFAIVAYVILALGAVLKGV